MSDRLCWFCKHVVFDPGCGGYSELTPGWDWDLSCRKNKFKILDGDMATLDDFRGRIETAKTCTAFEDREGGDG